MRTVLVGDDFAFVDDDDFDLVSQHAWHRAPRKQVVYARTNLPDGRSEYMHRLIMGCPDRQVDHRNGDGLDNRRENLRLATNAQNSANQRPRGGSSRFKGVALCKQTGRWEANIRVNYRQRKLGRFDTEEQAAAAYDAAAAEAFGEYAHLNLVEGQKR